MIPNLNVEIGGSDYEITIGGDTIEVEIDNGADGINGVDGQDGTSFIWQGSWSSSSVAYAENDVVAYNGSTYICTLAHTSSGAILPTNTTYWALMAQKGTDGSGSGDMMKSVYDSDDDGVIAIAQGGTGITSFTQGDILYASTTNNLSALAKNTTATRYISNTGTSNNPAWAQVNLSNGVTNTLPAGNGGTGNTSYTKGDILVASAGTTLTKLAVGTDGQAIVADPTQTTGLKYDWLVPANGWVSANETWTYASADSPTFTFTVSGDVTAKYSAGMRIMLTQTTTKYFIITAVSYSAPNTTVTVYGGTDYTLANTAITSPYYSTQKAPAGFPLNPDKWTVSFTDTTQRTQASPVAGTWYNLGSQQISVPIGAWFLEYKVLIAVTGAAASTGTYLAQQVTLSTGAGNASDSDFTTQVTANNTVEADGVLIARKNVNLASKTTYYMNSSLSVAGGNTIYNQNHIIPSKIKAVCAYL